MRRVSKKWTYLERRVKDILVTPETIQDLTKDIHKLLLVLPMAALQTNKIATQ